MRILPLALILAAVLPLSAQAITIKTIPPKTQAACKNQAAEQIDLLFVLDTTGSMGGLIQGAKTKIWRIVNDVMQNQRCGADVRVGLIGYRDKDDEYVTRKVNLNQDLDEVYAELMAFKAAGGGDEPEHVRLALHEGVNQMNWRANSKKVLFLVGDAPPKDSYIETPSVSHTAQKAKQKGIIINTLLAGDSKSTAKVWQSVAQYGGGEYFTIPQDGGSVAVTTPYDDQLSTLSGQLDQVYLPYGDRQVRHAAVAKSASKLSSIAAAPKEAQAERSINKSLNKQAYSQDDLVQSIENGKVKLDSIDSKQLPDNMQAMSASERQRYVEAQIQKRQQLKQEIAQVSKQREDYLQNNRQQNNQQGDSFDTAVSRALSKQLQ